jgi:hypothetical protein
MRAKKNERWAEPARFYQLASPLPRSPSDSRQAFVMHTTSASELAQSPRDPSSRTRGGPVDEPGEVALDVDVDAVRPAALLRAPYLLVDRHSPSAPLSPNTFFSGLELLVAGQVDFTEYTCEKASVAVMSSIFCCDTSNVSKPASLALCLQLESFVTLPSWPAPRLDALLPRPRRLVLDVFPGSSHLVDSSFAYSSYQH